MSEVGDGCYVDIFRKFVKCVICKEKNKCLRYTCEIDYKTDLFCTKKLWICDSCYDPENVYCCKAHKSQLKSTFCEFVGQSYGHSPVYWWGAGCLDDIGIVTRVYDTKCSFCLIDFKICKNHSSAPIKYTTCAQCCNDELDLDLNSWVHGLRRDRNSQIDLVFNQYIDIITKLEEPDEDGFVQHISKRQKRNIKENVRRTNRKFFYPLTI